MESGKTLAKSMIDQMPDGLSLEEISDRLLVSEKVRKGRQDISEGRSYTQEEVEAIFKPWISE